MFLYEKLSCNERRSRWIALRDARNFILLSFPVVYFALHRFFLIRGTATELINQLHAVSRIQQGRQREPSIKTLRSPLSAEF